MSFQKVNTRLVLPNWLARLTRIFKRVGTKVSAFINTERKGGGRVRGRRKSSVELESTKRDNYEQTRSEQLAGARELEGASNPVRSRSREIATANKLPVQPASRICEEKPR